MNVNKYNPADGYDAETYEALMQLVLEEKTGYMPLVYICSPFAGDEIGNMKKARVYNRFAFLNHCIPITPHIYFPQFCDEATEREKVMFMNMVLLAKCQEIWVFGDVITKGMQAEIDKAMERKSTKVRYFTTELKEKE